MTSCLSRFSSYSANSHGDTLYPITIKVQNAYNGYSDVTALSDTGNEKTIFKREVADLLGIPLERGEPFRVRGINGNGMEFRKFRLLIKIGNLDAIPVSIGFAVRPGDLAENLLGNEDVVKSGKFEAIYDDHGVTYRMKDGHHGKRIACGGSDESQRTLNNLYGQLVAGREKSSRRHRPQSGELVSNYGWVY